MNYIKDLRLKNNDNSYNVIIEIIKGCNHKMELKDESFDELLDVKKFKYKYPYYYGCFPRTYAGDKDPLDMILLTEKKYKTLDIVAVQPIAVIKTLDKGEQDDKVLVTDMETNPSSEYLNEIGTFIRKIAKESVVIQGVFDSEEAVKTIDEANKHFIENNIVNDIEENKIVCISGIASF